MIKSSKTIIQILPIILLLLAGGCSGPAKDSDLLESKPISRQTWADNHRAFSHYMKGVLYSLGGNVEKAADEYRLALFYDKDSDEIRRSLADANYQMRRYAESLEVADEINQKNIEDILLIGDCHALLGDDSLAVEYYEAASELEPAIDFPNDYLSTYYFETGNLEKAEFYYNRLIEYSENSGAWELELASFYIKSEQWDKAIDLYTGLIEADSLDNRGYMGLASIKEMQDETEAADSLYSLLIDLNPDNPSILNIVAQSFLRLQQPEKALEITQRIVELRPHDYLMKRRYALLQFNFGDPLKADSLLAELTETDSTEAAIEDPIAFYYRGRIAQQNEDLDFAEEMFVRTIELSDTLLEAWINLAFTYSARDSLDRALVVLDSAAIANPDNATEIKYYKGIVFSRAEIYDRAIDYYDQVLREYPDHLNALFNKGAAAERSGKHEEAAESFEKFLELEPGNAMALNYLGYMYADLGIKLDRAEKMIEQALEMSPDNSAYLDSFAWVLYKKGRFEAALEYQKKALKFDSEDPLMLEHMGDIYKSLEELQQARYHWSKALELDPENESIKEKLNR